MTMKKGFYEGSTVVNGARIEYVKVDHDYYGNPRYVVHFLALGVEPADYGKIKGLSKYRAKWYGGGIVIQSYSLQDDLVYYLNVVNDFYGRNRIEKAI